MKKTKTIIETGDVLLVLAASNSSIGYMFLLSLSYSRDVVITTPNLLNFFLPTRYYISDNTFF